MSFDVDFAERLTRLETQLAERYLSTEERYRVSEERYRITEERYRIMDAKYYAVLDSVTNLTAQLSGIEKSIQALPRTNGREHLFHVGAASLGGGSIVAALVELIKLLTT